MNLQKCENGHFYDADRNSSCPYCNGSNVAAANDFTVADQGDEINTVLETIPGTEDNFGVNDTILETIPGIDPTLPDPELQKIKTNPTEDKTIGFYDGAIGTDPVVGWLVCTEGVHKGEDFKLKTGRNYIGRTSDMDVVLSGEKSVSREKHSIVVYEPKTNKFFVLPGESTELAYLNDEVILQVTTMKAYDCITVGDVKLMFVPCCSDQFQWDKDEANKDKA